MLIIILIFIIILYLVKYSNNKDVIKDNTKNEVDKANIKNAKKFYNNTKYSIILLILTFISLVVIILCHFTNIDTFLINYFSTDFYYDTIFDYKLYLIPCYILVCRNLIIEVKLADYLYKYFNVKEEQIEAKELLKSVLYKKTSPSTEDVNLQNNNPMQSNSTNSNNTTNELPATDQTKNNEITNNNSNINSN